MRAVLGVPDPPPPPPPQVEYNNQLLAQLQQLEQEALDMGRDIHDKQDRLKEAVGVAKAAQKVGTGWTRLLAAVADIADNIAVAQEAEDMRRKAAIAEDVRVPRAAPPPPRRTRAGNGVRRPRGRLLTCAGGAGRGEGDGAASRGDGGRGRAAARDGREQAGGGRRARRV